MTNRFVVYSKLDYFGDEPMYIVMDTEEKKSVGGLFKSRDKAETYTDHRNFKTRWENV